MNIKIIKKISRLQLNFHQIALGAALLLSSCSCWGCLIKKKTSINEFSQKAIIEYLSTPNLFFDSMTGKGPIKIDACLYVRDSLCVGNKCYFHDRLYSPLLKIQKRPEPFNFVIPDSINDKYSYTDKNLNFERDYATIHQFSPLLPTVKKNTYLMEQYTWSNMCDDSLCIRTLCRGFLKFKIIRKKIHLQPEAIQILDQDDLIGLGAFQRRKLDNALPGEQIIRFGY